MSYQLDDIVLRKPETRDLEALYQQKNDPEMAKQLGGFSRGYASADLAQWLEFHRQASDEVMWVIAAASDDRCLGHVGFYRIDHRIGSAEFAIMIGDKAVQGKGIGKRVTRFALDYGFGMLNLNRIELNFLADNVRARGLYEGVGFRQEGILRQAQYKDGRYHDVILMSLLREDHHGHAG